MTDKFLAEQVIEALGALAHEHRLALFRLLVQAGADGMPAGAIAEALAMPNSSLSFHLAHLTRAGLIRHTRRSRSLIYTADYAAMNGAYIEFFRVNPPARATLSVTALPRPAARVEIKCSAVMHRR